PGDARRDLRGFGHCRRRRGEPDRLDVFDSVLALRGPLLDQCVHTRVCGHSCLLDNTSPQAIASARALSPTHPGSPAGPELFTGMVSSRLITRIVRTLKPQCSFSPEFPRN